MSDARPTYNRPVIPDKTAGRSPRILALDVGSRRIGLAVTNELGGAQGLPTLERTSRRHDLEVLEKIARKHGVTEIVVGRPVHMSGEQSQQAEKVEAFAELLREKTKLPIQFVDERLTSWQANEILDQQGLSRIDRKGKVDQIAAVLILEAFLETQEKGAKTQRD
jgi:putative Holliday junction resolvase